MKLLTFLSGSKKAQEVPNFLQADPASQEKQDQKDSLIQTGREQFKKLQELGLQIPIAVL